AWSAAGRAGRRGRSQLGARPRRADADRAAGAEPCRDLQADRAAGVALLLRRRAAVGRRLRSQEALQRSGTSADPADPLEARGAAPVEQGQHYRLHQAVVDHLELKLRDAMPLMFMAITGQSSSVSVLDAMEILGPDLTRFRLRQALELLGGTSKKEHKEWEKLLSAIG